MCQRSFLIKKSSLWYALIASILWCSAHTSFAQGDQISYVRDFGKLNEVYFQDSLWFFCAEDSGKVKNTFSDTEWDTLRHTDFGADQLPAGWRGIGWFALWIKVDTSLVSTKLSLRINHDGASELFLDGKPIGGYGKVGTSEADMQAIRAPKDIIPIWFHDTRPHLITIHYSNFAGVYPDFWGFKLSIGDYEVLSQRMARYNQLYDFVPMCAAAQGILGLLHFFLFLFYRKHKLNLYYSLFVLLIGINTAAIYLYYQTRSPGVQFFADFLSCECQVLVMWSGVSLLHVLNYGQVPRWRQYVLAATSLLYLILYVIKYAYFPTDPGNFYFSFVYFVCIMDGFWSVIQIVRRKQKGAWLIGAGVVAVILLYVFAWADTFQLWPYHLNAMRVFVLSTGQLFMPLCLSLYLGLEFAHTNHRLTNQLKEVEQLAAHALAQETEKRELIAGEAKRLEVTVMERTLELREQADKLKEMDALKSRFFTNITHEFRTPLTLIINPAKELLSESNDKQTQQHSRLIVDNATRLLQLINQLLDLSKLENGLMKINRQPLDVVEVVRMHTFSYASHGKQKGIAIHFISDWDELWISGDHDKLNKVILNLLSNAVKFTDHGFIEVSLKKNDEDGNYLSLIVKDTGCGIATSKLPYIFSRFYQADPSDTRSAQGTGIGLSVAKELVELMEGEIMVDSRVGEFTSVHIRMPYTLAQPMLETEVVSAFAEGEVTIDNSKIIDDSIDKPLLLLIEDHEELREFIHQMLAGKYRILSAANGTEGIRLGLEHIPNLVITDVMMPGVDGYQVCAAFKADEKTSHIPIIILTAKTTASSRIQGIETGADAYLGKPFDKQELFALIENLITGRNQLREYYSRGDFWLNNASSLPSMEQNFMSRVRMAIENHLDDEGYGAEQLAREIGLSRTQLHRKLKALIGQAPGEMIRIVRLQHAYDLLEHRVATIAEVAYRVGFSSPASFSASFSRHFGFPPKAVVTV